MQYRSRKAVNSTTSGQPRRVSASSRSGQDTRIRAHVLPRSCGIGVPERCHTLSSGLTMACAVNSSRPSPMLSPYTSRLRCASGAEALWSSSKIISCGRRFRSTWLSPPHETMSTSASLARSTPSTRMDRLIRDHVGNAFRHTPRPEAVVTIRMDCASTRSAAMTAAPVLPTRGWSHKKARRREARNLAPLICVGMGFTTPVLRFGRAAHNIIDGDNLSTKISIRG